MSRSVKCQDSGEYSTSDIAYKAPNKKYYTSQKAYEQIVKNNEYRNKCTNKMYDVLGYKSFMKIPTFWFKKLKEWESYGYDIVYNTICSQESSFDWALKNKQFNAETSKIMYMCSIIENHINELYKEKIRTNKDISDNIIIEDVEDIKISKQKTKDISSWLED